MAEDKLEDLPGIGPQTLDKLNAAGYTDLMSLAVATVIDLCDATGMGDSIAKKVITNARVKIDIGFETGAKLLKRREKVEKITTGSKAFDDMLEGGFETGSITEAYGEFGAAKTQLSHIMAVNLIKADPSAIAVYIDTENTFRPERIIQLAKGAKIDPDKALKNVRVARAYNSDHQMLLVEKVDQMIKDQNMKIKLLIVDSLTAHFRSEFVGRGTLADRQQKLNRHMRDLSKVASMHNICVYVTNQVMSKPDTFFGDPTNPIGGHIVAHASAFRIYLRKGKKGSRVAKLVDAPNIQDGECCFMVTTEGLKDL